MIDDLTCLILTYNEEANIGRTLDRLTWLKRIVVVDSGSTDTTLDILRRYPQVEVFQHNFDTFADQCNFGLGQVRSEWVLSLDADYLLTYELIEEIGRVPANSALDGYFAAFKQCIAGKPLRGTLYPSRQVLYRRHRAKYHNDGHGHRVVVGGTSGILKGVIWHDDQKPLSRWLAAQDRYMLIEAQMLEKARFNELNLPDRIRKLKIIAPFAVLLYCLIVKQGILDGWRGWNYAFQRMFVELFLSIRLIENDILRSDGPRQP